MQTAQYFQSQQQGNISSFVPRLSDPGSRYRSKDEVNIEIGEQSKLTSSRADLYLNDLDTHYSEVFRRAANPNLLPEDPGGKEALEFQARCIAQGVPKAALMQIESVRAYRSLGMGSLTTQLQITEALMAMLPILPENKRASVINARIAALAGQSGLEIFGIDDQETLSGNDASVASLENNAFMQGGQVVIDPSQNHYIHATIHLKFFGEIMQAVQGGSIDPRQALKTLQAGGPHLLIHLKYLSQDPTRKQQFDQLNLQTSELMKVADQLNAMVERISQQEAKQQQGQQPNVDPAMLVAQNTIQLNTEKARSEIEIKMAKAKQTLALKDATTAQKLKAQQILMDQKLAQSAA